MSPFHLYSAYLFLPFLHIQAQLCGSKFDRTNFIRGGNSINSGDWPWIVSVLDAPDRFQCGGALIADDAVLTAAHCITKADSKRRTLKTASMVRVGIGGRIYYVRAVYAHPNWKGQGSGDWAWDMAVLLLKRPVKSREHRPVCLPDIGDSPVPTERCVVVGWGETQTSSMSRTLQEVHISVADHNTCLNSWRRTPYNIDQQSMFCAGFLSPFYESQKGPCKGDSGGPLVCLRGDQWTVFGIVSWGSRPCWAKPGVFTNVSAATHWVSQMASVSRSDWSPNPIRNRNRNTKILPPSALANTRWRSLQRYADNRVHQTLFESQFDEKHVNDVKKTEITQAQTTTIPILVMNETLARKPLCDQDEFIDVFEGLWVTTAVLESVAAANSHECSFFCCLRINCIAAQFFPGKRSCELLRKRYCDVHRDSYFYEPSNSNNVIYTGKSCKFVQNTGSN